MPKLATPLTDIKVKSTKLKGTACKLPDGDGMYLSVRPDGSKLWYMDYRLNGYSFTRQVLVNGIPRSIRPAQWRSPVKLSVCGSVCGKHRVLQGAGRCGDG
jgi:hypothetical protein